MGLSATTVRGQVVGPVIGGQRRFDKPGTAPAGAASNPHMVRWWAQFAACCGGPQSARRAAGNAAKRNNSGQNGRLGRLQGALCGWGDHHIQEARLNRPRDRPRLAAGAGGGVWGAVYPHRRAGSGPAAERKGPARQPLRPLFITHSKPRLWKMLAAFSAATVYANTLAVHKSQLTFRRAVRHMEPPVKVDPVFRQVVDPGA